MSFLQVLVLKLEKPTMNIPKNVCYRLINEINIRCFEGIVNWFLTLYAKLLMQLTLSHSENEGSHSGSETLAAVVTAKYSNALALYRQVEIFKRGGLTLSRSTRANWCIKSGALLKPLVAAMHLHLLMQHSLCADEARVQVFIKPDKAATSQSYMWVYRSNEMSKQRLISMNISRVAVELA